MQEEEIRTPRKSNGRNPFLSSMARKMREIAKAKIKKEICVHLPEIPDVNDKSTPAKAVAAGAEPYVKSGPKAKKEPVDHDSGQVKNEVKNGETQENGSIAFPVADASGDAGIKRKNLSSSAWRRNFKQEERIGTLKRPRHALEEEIEEAERKKNGKK
jgi:hypothetical protein